MATKTEKEKKVRYNLTLPEEVYEEVARIADERHTTVINVLRMFIKLGLMAVEIDETSGASLLIREGKHERELLIL